MEKFSATAAKVDGQLIIRLPAPLTTLRQDIQRHLLCGGFLIYPALIHFMYAGFVVEDPFLFFIPAALLFFVPFFALCDNFFYRQLYENNPSICIDPTNRRLVWKNDTTCSFDDIKDVHYAVWLQSEDDRAIFGGYKLCIRVHGMPDLVMAMTNQSDTTATDPLASEVSAWLSKPLTKQEY